MSASSASTQAARAGPVRALALGLALALILVGEAVAQSDAEFDPDAGASGAPLRLAPLDAPESGDATAGAESRDDSRAADGSKAREPADSGAGQAIEGVEVDRLSAPDPAALGTLDPAGRGLDPALWRGTPRHVVVNLLPRLPGELASAALRDLAERLLLSAATPPRQRQADGEAGRSLLELRVAALGAIGAYDGVTDLLGVVPRAALTPPLARAWVEALFLQQRVDAACKRVGRTSATAAFWQKASAVCQVARGERAQADLTVSLLRETGTARHAGFLRAYDALVLGRLDDLDPDALEPLALGLLLAGDAPLPAAFALPARNTGFLAAVARHSPTALERRIRAAEIATARGALPPAELRTLYGAAAFDTTAEDESGPVGGVKAAAARASVPTSAALGLAAPLRRALAYQAAGTAEGAVARAELVREALAALPPAADIGVRHAFVPYLKSQTPRPALARFAATAGRSLYVTGHAKSAAAWLTMARAESLVSPEASAALTLLWPYAQLSGTTAVPVNGGLAAWRQMRLDDGGDIALGESLLKAAFEALGAQETRPWIELAAGDGGGGSRPVPSAAMLYALKEAGAAGRLGETVLLTVLALGGPGLDSVHPVTFHTALNALAAVGLEAPARRLAIEAALHNGI